MVGKDKKVTTLDEVVVIMRDAFQSNQDLIMGEIGSLKSEFGSLKSEVGSLRKEMRSGFEQVTQKISNLSRNAVDVVRQEDFDKLESRVVDLEEITQLSVKKS